MHDKDRHERRPVDVFPYLQGMSFPADRDAVIRHARRQDLDDELLKLLDRLPNRDYCSPDDVVKGISQAK